jgi:hypothetical protein
MWGVKRKVFAFLFHMKNGEDAAFERLLASYSVRLENAQHFKHE